MLTINSIFSDIAAFFSPENTPPVEDRAALEPEITDAVSPWTPERPQLTPPELLPCSRNSVSTLRLLGVTDESRALGDGLLETFSLRLSNVKEKIRTISAENMQKLKESAERASSSNFWSTLQKVATSLLSALSIIFGVAIVASGGGALIGGAMIASGILTLANFALCEFGTWDWIADQIAHDNEDQKKQIAMILPAAVGLVAAGIGLVGSVHGVATGALQFAEKAVFVAQTAVSLFGAATTFGKGVADARLIWTRADLLKLQAHLTVARENFTSVIDEIRGSMNEFSAVKTKTKKAIERITQSDIQLVKQI
jgi:hypothetical protein